MSRKDDAGYTKKTTDWLGREKEEHFDKSGEKVGETRFTTDWLGNDRAEHFDARGHRTGYSKDESDWIGNPTQRHYDSKGHVAGETRRGENWLGRTRKEHRGDYFKGVPSSPSTEPREGAQLAPSEGLGSHGGHAIATIIALVVCCCLVIAAYNSISQSSTPIIQPARPGYQAREPAAIPATLTKFPITVDYDQTIEEMMKAGNYAWIQFDWREEVGVKSELERASHHGTDEVEMVLVHFNRRMWSREALHELARIDLQPANVPELLAFGAAYPNIQLEYPVVALGFVVHGWSPYLYLLPPGISYASGRSLFLNGDGAGGWDPATRFAAVGK